MLGGWLNVKHEWVATYNDVYFEVQHPCIPLANQASELLASMLLTWRVIQVMTLWGKKQSTILNKMFLPCFPVVVLFLIDVLQLLMIKSMLHFFLHLFCTSKGKYTVAVDKWQRINITPFFLQYCMKRYTWSALLWFLLWRWHWDVSLVWPGHPQGSVSCQPLPAF